MHVRSFVFGAALLAMASPALAHFGMVIPSTSVVEEKSKATVDFSLSFSHPMEMVGMDMDKPKAFRVVVPGASEDLTADLTPATFLGHKAWKATYTLKKPGVYQFVVEPTPYWEPAEDSYIAHITKVYVAAFGAGEGWDEPAGLRTEIVPLTRPFGNYAGNVFQGQVLVDGKPVPGATVEVEHYNKDKAYAAPNELMVTQVVKADSNGIFTYAIPFPGWWGFAALTTAPETLERDGQAKHVELGAVLWAEFVSPKKAK
jgi:cobalt/nickel transport protein